ncbi:MAG: DUF4175 family protein [Terricaulis sp.]
MRFQDALQQLARETQRAKHRLMLERGLRAGLVLLFALGAWAAFALYGGQEALPLLAQSLTAAAALVVFAWLAWRAKRAWRAPTEDEARARLAQDSEVDVGAFDTLRDQPAHYDDFSVALWRRERERAAERVERVRVGPPRPRLDELDKYKARYVLAALLIGGVVVANSNAPDRLSRAFLPDPGPLLGDQELAVEAWVTPADYTHAGPVSLSDRVGQIVQTPPSVDATVRLTGPTGAPKLVFDGKGGHRETRFVRAADGAWEAHLALPGAGDLKIVRFHTRAVWHMAPTPDAAPTSAFAAPVALLPHERAQIRWRATDDFGVRRLLVRIRPVNPPEGLLRADPVDTEIDTPAGDPRDAQGQSEIDLAPHPYAGMDVYVQVVAVDALGQEGASAPQRVTLPEKVFLQPLARAAIEIRRHILTDRRAYRPAPHRDVKTMPAGDIVVGNARIEVRDYSINPAIERAPEGVKHAARLLDALTMEPQDGYFRDLAVFLGLRLARSELDTARDIGDTALAADTLWRTALRAEYGGAADARTALEQAQRDLAQALAEHAPPERIQQLMQALRDATQRYMQALVQQALRNGTRENAEDTQEQTSISQQDIQQMLDQVQQLSAQGRTQEAQALLQRLNEILQNMSVKLGQDGSGDQQGQNAEQQRQQRQMDQLSQTMGDQRALNDRTQQQQQQQGQRQQSQGGSGGNQQGGEGGDDLAQRQAQIRSALQDAQRDSQSQGGAPSPELDAANQAMRQAENALRAGDMRRAEAAQAAALQNLQEGARKLSEQMRGQGQSTGQNAQGNPPPGQDDNRDPLGRSATSGENGTGSNVHVPTGSSPARVQDIFNEIQRRAQDPNRPEAEREYLRRLLDRFGQDTGT